MFKIAISAGHWLGNPKGCPEYLDPKKTREWTLNDRIADKLEKLLTEYDGVEILRLDDTTGKKCVGNVARTTAANNWKADFYLAIHHNGGINGGKGGGIVAYAYKYGSNTAFEWQNDLYAAAVKATGLKGNRANPKPRNNLYEVRVPKMPAVLMECGFMDSATDCPIILTEDFADKMAKAFCDVIVKRSGAKKKKNADEEKTKNTFGTATVKLPIISRGSEGEAVKTLQTLLKAKGYCDAHEKELAADGVFGANTLYAFKAFQNDNGLTVDGYCGAASWSALID